MATGIYEININVNGAETRQAQVTPELQGVDPTTRKPKEITREMQDTRQQKIRDRQQAQELLDRQEQARSRSISALKKGAGIVVGAGAMAFTHIENTAEINGDSTKVRKLGEIKNAISIAATIGTGFAVGGILGGGAAAIYTVFNYAQQNRKLIHERNDDRYQSNYKQRRLVRDISGRSR